MPSLPQTLTFYFMSAKKKKMTLTWQVRARRPRMFLPKKTSNSESSGWFTWLSSDMCWVLVFPYLADLLKTIKLIRHRIQHLSFSPSLTWPLLLKLPPLGSLRCRGERNSLDLRPLPESLSRVPFMCSIISPFSNNLANKFSLIIQKHVNEKNRAHLCFWFSLSLLSMLTDIICPYSCLLELVFRQWTHFSSSQLWLMTKARLVPCCFAIGLFSGRLSPPSNAHQLFLHKDLSRPSRNGYYCGWLLLILWVQNLKKLSSVISK